MDANQDGKYLVPESFDGKISDKTVTGLWADTWDSEKRLDKLEYEQQAIYVPAYTSISVDNPEHLSVASK